MTSSALHPKMTARLDALRLKDIAHRKLEELSARGPVNNLARARLAAEALVDEHLRTSPSCTWLYFIQAGEGGPVKIGISETPVRRMANMQVGNHERLRLIAVARVPIDAESDLHARLVKHHVHGEWFRPAPAVLEIAQSYEARGHRAWLETEV